MKPSLMLPLVLLSAFALAAEEPKTEATRTSSTREESTSSTATAAGAEESPLVRAARLANRLGRKPKAAVITNESVKNSKGHITTSTVQRPIYVPNPQMAPSEAAALKKREAEREKERVRVIGEEQARQKKEESLERRARAAELAENGYLEDEENDPARAEREADEEAGAQNPTANTASDEKPPQG